MYVYDNIFVDFLMDIISLIEAINVFVPVIDYDKLYVFIMYRFRIFIECHL